VSAPDTTGATDVARADAERLGDFVERVVEHRGDVLVDVTTARLPEALRAAEATGYDFLCDVAATDYLDFGGEVAGYWAGPRGVSERDINSAGSWGLGVVPEPLGPKRFSVTYTMLARFSGPPRRLRLRVWVDDGEPVPTVVPVFPSADYPEREAFDLMGIPFEGHPNLERIFLAEGWDGHPHRKDYPLGGEPVQFSDDR
jgi:NADH-quinone oxidoreductase subunit C